VRSSVNPSLQPDEPRKLIATVDLLSRSSTLPGSDEARDFVGSDHGAELTLILVDAPVGHGPALHRHPYEEIFVVYRGTGTFFVDGSQVEAGPGDVVLAPAGTAHRFINSGGDRLRLTAIHHAPNFTTEWLERSSSDQDYWSSVT
jgi:quercetin dioxygenase-like cupin family protein